jgi:2'-5' RNA ligase
MSEIKLFVESVHSKGCAMAYVPPNSPLIKKLSKFKQAIPQVNVISLENEPHVTVLYGFLTDGAETRQILKATLQGSGITEINVKLGVISLFGPSSPVSKKDKEQEVIKVDCFSNELSFLNNLLAKTFPCENDFDVYHPHLTIAYVKSGSGDQYVGDDSFDGETFTVSEIIFSDKEDKQHIIKLNE